MSGNLEVADGWRKTVLDWRMSVSQGIVGGSPGFFPLAVGAQKRARLKIDSDAMAIEPYMGKNTTNPAYAAGLRPSDIITAVNPNITGRGFLVWFKQRFEPGDRVTVTAANASGTRREITYVLSPRAE